jgi:hypothetical protein
LNKDNFGIFEKILLKEIKKQSGWKYEFYNKYLLKMEQIVWDKRGNNTLAKTP